MGAVPRRTAAVPSGLRLALDNPAGGEHDGRMREVIRTQAAPTSPLYSQAVAAGGFLYVSGLVGVDAARGVVAGPTIQEQTRQALMNCESVVRAAGGGLDDVIEVGVLLADPDDFAGMNEEYARWFPKDPPARYAAKLGAVLPGILVSIRMTAYLGDGRAP